MSRVEVPRPDPDLSVLLVTHNQAQFLDDTTAGIDAQETARSVEVVVADDASSDSTPETLRRWAAHADRPVRFLPDEPRLGPTGNYARGFQACCGRYVAVLEGDDRWIDPEKLELQAQFLDQHPECAFVFNRLVMDHGGVESYVFPDLGLDGPLATLTGVELADDNFVGTFSACMYRADLIARLPAEIYSLTMYDWLFNLAISQHGLIGFLPRVMTSYRVHDGGTWSGMDPSEQRETAAALIWSYSDFLGPEYAPGLASYRRRIFAEQQELSVASPMTA